MTMRLDPRYYQILVLGTLLLYGVFFLRFDVTWQRAGLTLGSVLLAQWLLSRLWRLPAFEWRSALISGLSLCLLLRTNEWWAIAVAAVVTIGSKFVFRLKGKHFFNPTNFGIVFMLIFFSKDVWVSSGQWGVAAFAGLLMFGLGSFVAYHSRRSDIAVAFLLFWMVVLFGRSWMLGEPMTIPWHRIQNGAILLFAFHMISDPKTTPDSRVGRILFAAIVATAAWYIQFKMFRTNALLWSLAGCHVLVPLIDKILPGDRYDWDGRRGEPGVRPQTGISSSASGGLVPTGGSYEPA